MIKKYIFKIISNLFVMLEVLNVYSDNHNVLQVLETLKQDIKTLERAVYSDSFEKKNSNGKRSSPYQKIVLRRH